MRFSTCLSNQGTSPKALWIFRLICALLVLACVVVACPPTRAQVTGQNVNMVSGTQWPTGDPFLQRQNEPSMAVSTRNPMHILAGANDYRTVDLEAVLTNENGDAWLGVFKSFNGGLTWQSTLLPGCPVLVIQCNDGGVLQGHYQAGSDPVVRAGTNGLFYYAGLAFDRATGGASAVFISRFMDLNNKENGDPIAFINNKIIALGSNGHFLDKPSMAVDIPRGGANTCSFNIPQSDGSVVMQSFPGGRVFVAYTDFLAATKDNATPTHLMFTRSTDCGLTWSTPIQLNTGSTTSQGSTIAVDPNKDEVFVAWRQFKSTGVPDAIMIARSESGGRHFERPMQVSTFQPFDEGTTGTSFRTNAYPALAIDNFGIVYVAFSARGVGPGGDARVVLTASPRDGFFWTPPVAVDNPPPDPAGNPSGRGHQVMPALTFANGKLTLLYYDLRLDHTIAFYTPSLNTPGTYFQTPMFAGELAPPNPKPDQVFTPFIDDNGLTLRRHTIDLRVWQFGLFPTPAIGPSVLVSQYIYGCCVDPNNPNIQQLKFNVPNLPLFGQGTLPFFGDYIDIVPSPQFVPQGNSWVYNNQPKTAPVFHAVWTDNRDVVPPPDGDWTHYTPPFSNAVGGTSLFDPGGGAPPACVSGHEGMRNQNIYTSQISRGLIVGSPGNSKPLGTTIFNNNPVPFQRAFSVQAFNTTNLQKFFRLTILNQPTGGTASFLQFSLLTQLDVTIPPLSSISRSVFVTSTDPHASITVDVAEISGISGSPVNGGLENSTVLNPDITNPSITNPDITNPSITNPSITNFEVTNPDITNPSITNPSITNPSITNPDITNPSITNTSAANISTPNPSITNPDITNPSITNPSITNPDITNGAVSDTTWTVSNTGNTTSTYAAKLISNQQPPGSFVLQLIISKTYTTPASVSCNLIEEKRTVPLVNVTNPALLSPADPNLGNPDITNPSPNNATLALEPGETANITLRVVNPDRNSNTTFDPATAVVPAIVPHAVNTQTVLQNGGNQVNPPVTIPLTITTVALPDGVLGHSYSATLQATGGNPGARTWSIVSEGGFPDGLILNTSTGAITGIPTFASTFTFDVQVMDTGVPQHTATKTFSIRIGAILRVTTTALPDAGVGPSYNENLAAVGGLGAYSWSLADSSLPPGLNLSVSGAITGNPTTAGPFNFTVRVQDSSVPTPQVAFKNLSINVTTGVAPGSHMLFIVQPNNAQGGQAISPAIFVQLFDANNTPITGADVTLTLGPQPCSAATLSGTLTATTENTNVVGSMEKGVATFSNVSIDRGGEGYTLVAQATSNSSVAAISNPFTVTGFCGTGSLNGARRNHLAISLPNGKVLIAGGTANANFTGTLATAEIYDPTTATFTTISSMNAARADYSAIVLPNGKVLIAGGFNDTQDLASAELFDPATNTFTLLSSFMSSARGEHTATLLPNGKVLILGGNQSNTVTLATADLFDPATNTFTPSEGAMSTPRQAFHADLLPNGKVLITGGFDTNLNALASAELYDPASDTFTLTGSMATARGNHASAVLSTGKVLVAGGSTGPNLTSTATAELYDPSSGMFSSTGSLTQARARYFSTVLRNGKVLISDGAPSSIATTAEVYDPVAGTFSSTGTTTFAHSGGREALLPNGTVLIAGGFAGTAPVTNPEIFYPDNPPFLVEEFTPTSNLVSVRKTGVATLLPNGKILITGGFGNSGVTNTAELYDPVAGSFASTGTMVSARAFHTATLLPNGKVLIAGGVSSATLNTAELYDPATGTFTATGTMLNPRFDHTATLLANGLVLIAGGRNGATDLFFAELYDPSDGIFTNTANLNTARSSHSATLLPNGTVLIAGGLGTGGAQQSAELFDTAGGSNGLFSATGSLVHARWFHSATLLRNGKVLIAGGRDGSGVLNSAELFDPTSATFTLTANLSTPREFHTATLLPNSKVLFAGGTQDLLNNSNSFVSSAELFDPAANSNAGGFQATASLTTPRNAAAAALLPTGKVLVAGGATASAFLNTGEQFQSGEIRQLATYSCALEGHIESINGDNPTSIRFVNNSAQTIQVFWLDYTGLRDHNNVINQPYAVLAPGQSYVQLTFLTHPWVIADNTPSATCQAIYFPVEGEAPVFIGSASGPPSFMLTVTDTNAGSLGGVISNPPGLNCATTCSASFISGTTVTLAPEVTPANWVGCDSVDGNPASTHGNSCRVLMNANRAVTVSP